MNEQTDDNSKPFVPSYWRIYLSMVLSSWWDVARYIFSVRRPDQEPGSKKFGLLLTIVSEFAKIAGSVITIVIAFIAVIVMGIIWPVATPVVDLFLAYIVLTRVKRRIAESEANTEKLAEDLAEK